MSKRIPLKMYFETMINLINMDLDNKIDDKSKRKVEIMRIVRKAMAQVQSTLVDLLVYYSDEFN
jgi:hypothetical protein